MHLYPPDARLASWWLTSSSTGFSYPDAASLSPLFDVAVPGQIFPLGVPLADVYLGQNGWPTLPVQDFTPTTSAVRPPYVPPSLGADLRVATTLRRGRTREEIVAVVTITNKGLSPATNIELTQARLQGKEASSDLPTRHTRLAAGRSHTLHLRFPGSIGAAGQQALLRLGGRHQGGTFGASLRVRLP